MKIMDDGEIHSILRLLSVPGIGAGRVRRLISHFQSPSAVLKADRSSLMMMEGIDKVLADNIRKKNNSSFADKQLDVCKKNNIQIISYWDKSYPPNLKEIHDPPIILFVKGCLIPDDIISLGVVGTRNPSTYGRVVTERLIRDLVRNGFTISSGLARGIDTIAHQGCVKHGGRTIAVLGSGLDIIYPAENKKLATKIIKNGAIITEQPCGSMPDASNFPKRNRIISGLSLGVLVIEAGIKSGALITASLALDQNREVYAVPGNIYSAKSMGTNQLIKEGAKLVHSVEDVIEELKPKIQAFTTPNAAYKTLDVNMSEKEKRLLDILSDKPLHIDFISQQTGFSVAETLSVLLTLELKDLVKQFTGKMFVRI